MKHCNLWLLTAGLLGAGAVAVFGLPPRPVPAGTLTAARTNAPGPSTNRFHLNPQVPGVPLGRKGASQAVAPPGLYASEPYKCLVVVPPPQLDDRCLMAGNDSTVPMPIIRPELRLVPVTK